MTQMRTVHAGPGPGAVVAQRFVVEAVAGRGGMGQVLRARDRLTGQAVALKVLHLGREADRDRFLREARLLAELRHPGIVGYVAHGVTPEGHPYLAMEWLDGEDLARRLQRGALPLLPAVRLCRKVAEALAAAHRAGVVHRDLKPANLFLRQGELDRVTLLDFGIAGDERGDDGADPGRRGEVTGTPLYMAPEQLQAGGGCTAAADVYSLGGVLFACLTGRPPFAGESTMSLLHQVLTVPVPPLHSVCPTLPATAAALDPLLGRMLGKDPLRRPPDGAAVVAELDGVLAGLTESEAGAGAPSVGAESFGELELVTILLADLGAAALPPSVAAAAAAVGAEVVHHGDGPWTLTIPAGAFEWPGDAVAVAAQLAVGVSPTGVAAIATGRRPAGGPVQGPSEAVARAEALLVEQRGQRGLRLAALSAVLGGERAGTATVRTALVGRDRELGMLDGLLAQCGEDGRAQAVLCFGPPGIGKSRLAAELIARLDERGEAVAIRRACASPLESGAAGSLLAALGFPSRDGEELAQTLAAELGKSGGPLLLILDDLQWADGPSLRALDRALEELAERPLFVLALGRPELLARFPQLWSGRRLQHLRLGGLTRRAAERLLGNELPPERRAELAAQADGNPWLLGALARHAADGGEGLPEAVLAVLWARIGRLEPGARRVLLGAGSLGETFTRGELQQLLVRRGATSPEETARWVDILVGQELLVATAEGALAFRTGLVRAAARDLLRQPAGG